MDTKNVIIDLPKNVHFALIEPVACRICAVLFRQDSRFRCIEVEIVKLAISKPESTGIRMKRPASALTSLH
jgi:dihydroneopterin aldolase